MNVDGLWLDGGPRAGSGAPLTLIEPFSGEELATVSQGTVADLDEAITAAARAFRDSGWRYMAPLRRADVLRGCALRLRERREEIGLLEARNVGRPLRECETNVDLAADAFDWFAGLTTHVRGSSIPLGPGLLDYTIREPLGVCGVITPWNNPIVLSSWKVAAGLAAGNALVVKPASLTPLSILRIAELLSAAGLPDGQMNVVAGPGASLGDHLIGHRAVAKLSFTGSTATGKHVMRKAADRLARVSLELGGKSPSIVFADAPLEQALAGSIPAMFTNAGQMCTARSRILVHEDIADEFAARLAERVSALRLGSPLDPDTDVGPVISRGQMDSICGFLERALDAGATIAAGGGVPRLAPELAGGFFVVPTVLSDVADDMEAVREEIFGPVLVVDRFTDERDAIARSNGSPYGLAATIWTRDLGRAHRVASALEAGTITVNTTKVSHVYAPFGGVKESGIGRELGVEGLDEYLQVKNVIVAVDG